jgi:N-acetyl-gamma-glutamyl-phosphate reductase
VVYGLPEFFRPDIVRAAWVANPGCFVTAAVLGIYPLLKAQMVEANTLIIDAKSGLTGAGRQPKLESMFTYISENVVPYKLAGRHQHTPEMEMVLSRATGHPSSISLDGTAGAG